MNNLKCAGKHLYCVVFVAVAFGAISCEKAQELTSIMPFWSDEDGQDEEARQTHIVEVLAVDQSEGKKIINSESRLVIVEYYSDT